MPRQRMVRPDFFSSPSLAECSHSARLAFIGLWVMGDDNGNMRLSVRKLNRTIFPLDDIEDAEFAGMLGELERQGCIRVYEADGDRYLNVTNFGIYQYVRNPAKSNNPQPPKGLPKRTSYFETWDANTSLTHSYHTANTRLTPKKEGKKETDNPMGLSVKEDARAVGPAGDGPADDAATPEEVAMYVSMITEAVGR